MGYSGTQWPEGLNDEEALQRLQTLCLTEELYRLPACRFLGAVTSLEFLNDENPPPRLVFTLSGERYAVNHPAMNNRGNI